MSHCAPAAVASRAAEAGVLVALVGRPNSGKSSLFNRITGGSAHVGNFPGVTVDILEADAMLPGGIRASIADLPGLYSLEASLDPATDEGIAHRFVEEALRGPRPLTIVQVVDGTQLALGLRLTRELLRVPAPVVVAVTQSDLLRKEGRTLDENALSAELGVPVVAVSARETAASGRVLGAVADALHRENAARPQELSPDAVAARVLREAAFADDEARARRQLTAKLDAVLLHPIVGPAAFLTLMAAIFAAIFLVAAPVSSVLDSVNATLGAFLRPRLGGGLFASFVCDGLLGGAGTVLAFMPQIVILTVAMELLDASGYLARGAFLVHRVLRLMGLSGRAFVPLLMGHACAVPAIGATRIIRDPKERLTTILVIPLMTCSARIPTYALVLATFFARSGPLVQALLFVGLYFAGIVSGLVASLVLRRSATKGRMLPLVLELPAYRAPQGTVVARQAGRAAWRFLADVGSTILVASAILWALLTVPAPAAFRAATPEPAAAVATSAEPTSAEPTSAEPTPANDPSASTEAVAAAPDGPAEPLERVVRPAIQDSVAATLGRGLEPLTRPLGFDWRINVGLIGAFGARELMVGTLGIIFGIEGAEDDATPLAEQLRDAKKPDGSPVYDVPTGLALLAFFVLACQCMSTVAAIRRETRSLRWPAFVLAYTYAVAYLAALLVYNGSRLLGLGG